MSGPNLDKTRQCLRCGSIKWGAICDCSECGHGSTGDARLDIVFSDHHMSRKNLEDFGNFLKQLIACCEKQDVHFGAFMSFVSAKHPIILSADIPESLEAEVEASLAEVEHPNIELEPGIREQIEIQRKEKQARKKKRSDDRRHYLKRFLAKFFDRSRPE